MTAILLLLGGCGSAAPKADIAATTLPVYEFTSRLCQGTELTVARLITESVSCLHDHSLSVDQARTAQAADRIVISGAGLEEFMEDLLGSKQTIDASQGIPLLESCHGHHHEDHAHEHDSHIWLSPGNAKIMAENICAGLIAAYPQYEAVFSGNLAALQTELDALQAYGEASLAPLQCRELITFHDGFAYFAEAFGLTVLAAVEEESGSEASAAELKELIELVRSRNLPAVFTETNGSTSAAGVLSRETGVTVFTLDMVMSGDSYFDAMYHNINTVKEALG